MPLHEAVLHGHSDIVELLCKGGAMVDVKEHYTKTPLLLASELGHTDIVQTLVNYKASINVQDIGGSTPLCHAVKHKNFDMCEILLRARCDVNIQDNYKRTALHIASEKGLEEAVDILLEHGAKFNIPDRYELAPLQYTISGGHVKCAFSLLKHGHVLPESECKVLQLIQMLMTKQEDRVGLLKMLVYLGWRPKTFGISKLTEFLRQSVPKKEVIPWLESEVYTPLSLKRIGRNAVRKYLVRRTNGISICKLINRLAVPDNLKDFLELRDLYIMFIGI